MKKIIFFISFVLVFATVFATVNVFTQKKNSVKSNISHAEYINASCAYPQAVMGPKVPNRGSLVLYDSSLRPYQVDLPNSTIDGRVFEDLMPRLGDLNADAFADAVTVETDVQKGSSIAIYSIINKKAVKVGQTPYLGKQPAWYAIVGISDFNGDGRDDIAAVAKPHGGRLLQFWTLTDSGEMKMYAEVEGVTMHVEGTNLFQTAMMRCPGKRTKVIVTDGDWKKLYAVGIDKVTGKPTKTEIGDYKGYASAQEVANKCLQN